MAESTLEKCPVFVTRSVLPPLEAYLECVQNIFSSNWLTNHGRYTETLEQALTQFLSVPSLSLCANGTLALQLAIRLLGLHGKKVITTPFTYVATTSALLWEGCTPIFADIDPHTLCISPEQVEKCIRNHPDVAGILPVHVYGNSCDVEALGQLAAQYDLRLLYDAAHAFGCMLKDKSLFSWGDASIGSFHATKLFHCVEGGCIVTHDSQQKKRLELLRAFGHNGDDHVCLGINAKLSELHSAMGLTLLPLVPDLMVKRAQKTSLYNTLFDASGESGIQRPRLATGLQWNHAYYPIIFPDHASMLKAVADLNKQNIHPRRYFYPSLNKLPYLTGPACPVAEDMAERVLCLPLWPDMDDALVENIAAIALGHPK